jgi:polyisoprenoid-binding protein YceI
MIPHRKRLHTRLMLAFLLTLSTAALAQKALDFNVDPATTAIHWTLNTNVHGDIHGTFKLKSGAIHIDPATGNASGLIVIDAASGESGDASRDSRMNKVVLDTDKYPTITYRPTHVAGKVDPSAPGPITVDGVMNLHGQDHAMQMSVTLHPKDSAITSQTHFTIPFVAWGMKDPSFMMFRTGKQVDIEIDATAVPTPATAHALNSPARAILRPNEMGIGR